MHNCITQRAKRAFFATRNRIALVGGGLLALGGNAMAVAPLDLDATGTTVAGYVGEAAVAGAVVFAAMVGVRLIVRAFKAVAK